MRYLLTLLGFGFFSAAALAQNFEFTRCDTAECQTYFSEYKKYARIHSNAAGILGTMYLVGYGTEPDEQEALRYFKRGATFHDADSSLKAGLMLFKRDNKDDKEQGMFYLKLAGQLGSANAAYFLATIYGVPDYDHQDTEQADLWLARAIEYNHPHIDNVIEAITENGAVTQTLYPQTWKALKRNEDELVDGEDPHHDKQLAKYRGGKDIEVIQVSAMQLEDALEYGVYSMYAQEGDIHHSGYRGNKTCRGNEPFCRSVNLEDFKRLQQQAR